MTQAQPMNEGEALPIQTPFSYDLLDNDTAQYLRLEAEAIRRLDVGRTQADIEIGLRLIRVKSRIPKGHWQHWLDEEFSWSDGHASWLIRAAKAFGDLDLRNVQVASTALKILCFTHLPPEIIEEARALLTSRHSITIEDARALVRPVDQELGGDTYWQGRKRREASQIVANIGEVQKTVHKLQVALGNAYPVPLKYPVGKILDELIDLVSVLVPDPNARQFKKRKRKATSHFHGVLWRKDRQKWIVDIFDPIQQRRIKAGSFDTEEEAARAYDAKAREFYADRARLNFPDSA